MIHDAKLISKQGFTLIELLVVLAIIGILASVVLASLNTARDKGANAAIKSDLTSSKAQAEIYYQSSGSVFEINNLNDSICVNTASMTVAGIADNVIASDIANLSGAVDCNDDPTSWAVAAQLVGASVGNYYCVDSTGFSDELVGTIGVEFADDALECK